MDILKHNIKNYKNTLQNNYKLNSNLNDNGKYKIKSKFKIFINTLL